MTNPRRRAGETFADVVAALPAAQEGLAKGVMRLSPITDGRWVDRDGVVWHRHDHGLTVARLRALFRDADVRVVHVMDEVEELDAVGRAELWTRMRPYLKERPREPGDHTDFLAGEFRSGTSRLLVVEETC